MEAACNGIDGGVVLAFQGGNFGSAGKVDHNVSCRSSQIGSLCILCTASVTSSGGCCVACTLLLPSLLLAVLEATKCMVLPRRKCRVCRGCASGPAFPAIRPVGRLRRISHHHRWQLAAAADHSHGVLSARRWTRMLQGAKTAAEAAAKAGVQRVLLISSLFVTQQHRHSPLRMMLNTLRWRMMDNKVLLLSRAYALHMLSCWPPPKHAQAGLHLPASQMLHRRAA